MTIENDKQPACCVCGYEIDDGYCECEECHTLYCSEHADLTSLYNGELLCYVCKTVKQINDIQETVEKMRESFIQIHNKGRAA